MGSVLVRSHFTHPTGVSYTMLSALLVAAAIALASVSPGGPLASSNGVSGGGPAAPASASTQPSSGSSTDSVSPSGPL